MASVVRFKDVCLRCAGALTSCPCCWPISRVCRATPRPSLQANQRILDAAASRYEFPTDRVVSNLGEYGNTSAASIPLVSASSPADRHVGASAPVVAAGLDRTARSQPPLLGEPIDQLQLAEG